MATIKFLIVNNNNPTHIYIRYVDSKRTDYKFKTNFLINPENWSRSKGYLKHVRTSELKKLDNDLTKLKSNLVNAINNNSGRVTLNWLKDFINPPDNNKAPKYLWDYFNYYLAEKTNLAPSTIRKIKVVQNKIKKIQDENNCRYLISDIDMNFNQEFNNWNIKNGYNENTIKGNLSVIKTMCYHALKRGIQVNNEFEEINTAHKKAISIYLTPKELKKIEKLSLSNHLETARDWLIISCYTGQRVSDFMRFTSEMITTQKEVVLIEFVQKKTGKKIALPLHKKVLNILKKRKGEFPDKQLDQHYNKYIKEVCEKAKINDMVYGGLSKRLKKGKIRKIFDHYEKWQLVSSHIGRRSFATNFYGKIPTALLIGATGHSTEAMFLHYIGRSSSDNALELAKWFNN